MMELCPTGPLYLEIGNGIPSVMERLSQRTTSRATTSMDVVVLRGRYCRFIDTHVAPEEIHDVLSMASCLPNLQRLSLLRLRVPVAAITSVLSTATSSRTGGGLDRLQELELRSIILAGSAGELQALAGALQHHSSLTKISLADCRPEGGDCRHLDVLLQAMGQMPRLHTVELDMMELPRWFRSVDSFQQLLASRNLQCLSLSYMRIPEDYIATMADALAAQSIKSKVNPNHATPATSTAPTPMPTPTPPLCYPHLPLECHNNYTQQCRLQELCLDRCDSLTQQSALVMGHMLRTNTTLTKLKLVIKNYHHAIPIAHAICENAHTQLEYLFLRTYYHPHVAAVAAAARRLRQGQGQGRRQRPHQIQHDLPNDIIDHPPPPPPPQEGGVVVNDNMDTDTIDDNVIVNLNSVSPPVYRAFRDMLQHNYTVQQLELFQGHPMRPLLTMDPTMNFYLKLNRAGRGRLLRKMNTDSANNNDMEVVVMEASNEEWVKVIIACRFDLEICFYFLSQNPSVVTSAIAS